MKKLFLWIQCTRAYSLPMSVTAWAIPFSLGCFNDGNILYGFIALVGIICAHLGANLFDDIIDYKGYLKNSAKNGNINLKKGKCKCFIENQISLFAAYKAVVFLFFIAVLTGIFFVYIYKLPVLIIMAIAAFLCLLYPKSGRFGLSELIIGFMFSPLLFTGVYFVMTGGLSQKLEWMSLSFALVTITLLYTDFFLDYNSDKINGKKTIPVISGSKNNAYYFYIFIIFLIYANLFFGIHAHIFSLKYLLIFLSVFPALKTMRNLQYYIDKEIHDEKDFMSAMNDVQKFVASFAALCIISFYIG